MVSASAPKPVKKPNPEGPIKPLDLPEIPEIPEIPVGDSKLRIDGDKGVTLSTEIGGIPLDLSLGDEGFSIEQQRE